MDKSDRWLSIDEISQYLGTSPDSIYRWIEHDSMPASKIGRFWKFKKDKVDAWVEAGLSCKSTRKQRLVEVQ